MNAMASKSLVDILIEPNHFRVAAHVFNIYGTIVMPLITGYDLGKQGLPPNTIAAVDLSLGSNLIAALSEINYDSEVKGVVWYKSTPTALKALFIVGGSSGTAYGLHILGHTIGALSNM